MEHTFNLREFEINDYAAVIELWSFSGLPYRPKGRDRKEKNAKELNNGTAIFLVAEIKNRIVGVIFGTHDGRKGWVNRLAVHPDFKCKGIAKALVADVEKRLLEAGVEIITCLIENDNIASQAVFRKLGFKAWEDITYFSKRMNPDV